MAGGGKIAGGIILLIIGIILSGLSYSIINQCNSFSGQLGTFLDTRNQETCAIGSFLLIVGIFMAIIGIVLIILGAVSKKQKSQTGGIVKQTSQTKWFCRFCGRSILQQGEFCPDCGRNLRSGTDTNATKECTECRSTTSQDSDYCANCGKMFSNPKTGSTTEREERNANESVNHEVAERFCNDASCERTRKGEKHPVHSSVTYTRSTNRISRTTWVLIGIGAAIAVAVGGIIYSYSVTEQGYIQPSQLYTETTPAQPASQIVVQESITLEAGYYKYYQFSTPPNAVNVRLSGTVGVTGGIVPQILIYVMDTGQCAPPSGGQFNLQGCNSYYVNGYYNDGSFVDIYLPAGATFYLAFSNDAVLGERKIVDASFTLESE